MDRKLNEDIEMYKDAVVRIISEDIQRCKDKKNELLTEKSRMENLLDEEDRQDDYLYQQNEAQIAKVDETIKNHKNAAKFSIERIIETLKERNKEIASEYMNKKPGQVELEASRLETENQGLAYTINNKQQVIKETIELMNKYKEMKDYDRVTELDKKIEGLKQEVSDMKEQQKINMDKIDTCRNFAEEYTKNLETIKLYKDIAKRHDIELELTKSEPVKEEATQEESKEVENQEATKVENEVIIEENEVNEEQPEVVKKEATKIEPEKEEKEEAKAETKKAEATKKESEQEVEAYSMWGDEWFAPEQEQVEHEEEIQEEAEQEVEAYSTWGDEWFAPTQETAKTPEKVSTTEKTVGNFAKMDQEARRLKEEHEKELREQLAKQQEKESQESKETPVGGFKAMDEKAKRLKEEHEKELREQLARNDDKGIDIVISAKDEAVYLNDKKWFVDFEETLKDKKEMFKRLDINSIIKQELKTKNIFKVLSMRGKIDPVVISAIEKSGNEKSDQVLRDYIYSLDDKELQRSDDSADYSIFYDLKNSELDASVDKKMQKYARHADKVDGILVEGLKARGPKAWFKAFMDRVKIPKLSKGKDENQKSYFDKVREVHQDTREVDTPEILENKFTERDVKNSFVPLADAHTKAKLEEISRQYAAEQENVIPNLNTRKEDVKVTTYGGKKVEESVLKTSKVYEDDERR